MMKRLFVFLLLLLIVASCRTGDNATFVPTITPIAPEVRTETATNVPTATTIPSPTIPSDVMRYQCLKIVESLPLDYSLSGVAVYNDEDNLNAYLSNYEVGNTDFFPREAGDRLLQFDVSPDGKHIIYIHSSVKTKERSLVLATANGQPIWSQAIDDYAWDWFDNERLVSSYTSEDGKHGLLLLNPFNGEQKRLPADFPDSEAFSPDWFGHWYYTSRGLPIYDPTLTRVLYPAIEEKEKWGSIIVWDTQANQKIAEIVTMDNWGDTPIWTLDGKEFIIATNLDLPHRASTLKEFFAVSRDGEIKQLTRFANSFAKVNIMDSYKLSPDGKLVAFWIIAQPSPHDGPSLAVLNVETGNVNNYCIEGDPFVDGEAEPPPPVWSPDSTRLLVISRAPEDRKVRRVVMVDIVHNDAAKINQDMEPVGWMVAP